MELFFYSTVHDVTSLLNRVTGCWHCINPSSVSHSIVLSHQTWHPTHHTPLCPTDALAEFPRLSPTTVDLLDVVFLPRLRRQRFRSQESDIKRGCHLKEVDPGVRGWDAALRETESSHKTLVSPQKKINVSLTINPAPDSCLPMWSFPLKAVPTTAMPSTKFRHSTMSVQEPALYWWIASL